MSLCSPWFGRVDAEVPFPPFDSVEDQVFGFDGRYFPPFPPPLPELDVVAGPPQAERSTSEGPETVVESTTLACNQLILELTDQPL